MASFEDYTKWFERKENGNWLKVSVGLIITKHGLAPFVVRTLETFKNGQVSPGNICSACSTAAIVPCNPRNKICKGKNCKFHQGVAYRTCPKNICDGFRKAIINEHRFADRNKTSGPSWRNTNACDWCSNAWEVAKAFMPPDGYDKITTSEDTDLNGVVSVLINCLLFEQYIPDLANAVNVGTKVRDIGRKVRHASQIEVTDADLKQWFDDMRALFQIPQHFAANSDAQNTIDLLNKLETDQLHIERTDVLAAIKDVVTSLERLTSSTDAETLADNIKKFRDIQQEIAAEAEEHKRDICDFVDAKKDDLTHHANVSISDIDKRIEANQQSLNELKTEVKEHKRDIGELADRKKADLTQYAKELILDIDQKLEADQQSLNVFKKELKDNLLQHHSKINSTLLLGPFFSEGDASLKDFYVQPRLSEVLTNSMSNNKFELKKRPNTSLEQLLTPADTKQVFTIITAAAGVGKTSFCKFLAVQWCAVHEQKNDNLCSFEDRIDISFKSLRAMAYLFYINMRFVKTDVVHSIEEIVFAHLETEIGYQREDRERLEKIFMDERGLVILDGLDESSLSILKPPMANRKYNVIITCRPWKLADMAVPKYMYMHLNIEDLSQMSQRRLFKHANKVLNKQFGTSFKFEDFLAAIETQQLQSLTSNTLVGLQLYCLWHDRYIDDITSETSTQYVKLGKTISHIYADVLEMMIDLGNKKSKDNSHQTQIQVKKQNILPTCFEGHKACYAKAETIYRIGKIAFQMLINSKSEFDQDTMNSLQQEQFLLDSGLISTNILYKCSKKIKVYHFLHKTYQEMLAATYLSSLKFESEDWIAYENNFEAAYSPHMMSFICVMNYDLGRRCTYLFGDMDREFYRLQNLQTNEIIEHQSDVLLAYNECIANGVSEPQLLLKHVYIDNVHISEDHHILKINKDKIQTSCIINLDACVVDMISKDNVAAKETNTIHRQHFALSTYTNLKLLWLENCHLQNDCIDLSFLKHLSKLFLENKDLKRVTIAPDQFEIFFVFKREKLRVTKPPTEVIFAQGEQFSNSLLFLGLHNVTFQDDLNIQHCHKLQTLQLEMFTIHNDVNVSLKEDLNIQKCHKLQKLCLDTFTFHDDFHLDLSSFTELNEIVLRCLNLKRLTIPSAQLKRFWVDTRKELRGKTPPIEVIFAEGEPFSKTLLELRLVDVTLKEDLNIRECHKLQILHLDSFTFLGDFHLDLSSFSDLNSIVLRDINAKKETITPAKLNRLFVYEREELLGNTPPIEVIFAKGVPFSNTLLELRLVNVTLKEDLYIQECHKLQILCLDTFTFHDDFHLDLSSFTELNEIVLRCLNLKRLTIPLAQLKMFCVDKRAELQGKTHPIEVIFAEGVPFSNTLLELRLVNVTLKEDLNIRQCHKLQKLCLDTFTFHDDFHLDLSSFSDLNSIVLRDINAKKATITPAKLNRFLIDKREELLGKTPPIEVIFAEGEPFSNTLLELRLVNVTLKEDLNIQQCNKLQILHLDTFTFHDDSHLDLSSFSDLNSIVLREINAKQVTITPAQLKMFWVDVREELQGKTPPIEVIFAEGVPFSNTLLEVRLVNVTLKEDLKIRQCHKLQKLCLDTFTFHDDFHLDLSSFSDLNSIVLRDINAKQVTITSAQLKRFWVDVREELQGKTPPIEVIFAEGVPFSNTLLELRLVNVTLKEDLNIRQCHKLQKLCLDTFTFHDDFHLDLSSFSDLNSIVLRDINAKKATITPAKLNRFLIDKREELLGKTPPIEVIFAEGEPFSNTLLELRLVNVTLKEDLNIQQCNKLQILHLDTFTFHDDSHLDLSSFSDLNSIVLRDINAKQVIITPAQLKMFLVDVREELQGKTPPIEVIFAEGVPFSNKLLELRLVNVTLKEDLNIQQCNKLQILHLDTFTFKDDFCLDLSSFTELCEIVLRSLNLERLTIPSAQLKRFWVDKREELLWKTPPIEVIFAEGELFSNTLLELKLVDVTLKEDLNIQQCNKLQILYLDKLTFHDDFHLDLSSFSDLNEIVLQDINAKQVTITPAQLKMLWVDVREELQGKTPPIEVVFAEGVPFSNTLLELRLINVTLKEDLNIRECLNLQILELDTLLFPNQSYLDLSSFTYLNEIVLRCLNLKHLTIPSAQLEKCWVVTREDLRGKTPPMEVIVAQMEPFSNTLLRLCLINVTIKENLNIRQCLNLQILQLDKLFFQNDSYLDLSSFTELNCIVLRDINAKQVTISPAQLKILWVDVREELRGKTFPMDVIFAEGGPFSNTLLELRLVNVTLKVYLNIRECLNLQILELDTVLFPNDSYLDLSSFTYLNSIVLRDINAKQVTITPAQLKTLWVDVREELQGKTPPIEVIFAEGVPFSNTLLELCLINVTLKEDLNIRQCLNLQILHLDKLLFQNDSYLDLSSFTDLNSIVLRDINAKQVTITPAQLNIFLVYVREELIGKTPPIEVIFGKGVPFSNTLLELRLVNVTFKEDLNIQECHKLQKLCLDTFTFHNDFHLDLSSFTELNEIVLRCLNLKRLTIPSAQLKRFWVDKREELLGTTPPIEVIFAQGEPFSKTLLELRLVNVTFKEDLNIRQCHKLQILHLDTFTFHDDFHLDLSSFSDLNSIYLCDINAKQMNITPAQLKRFWVDKREELLGKTPPIEVIFAEREPFSNTLLELKLVNVTLKEDLNIQQCNKLQILFLDMFTFIDDFYLDLSSFSDLHSIVLRDINAKQVTITPAQLKTLCVDVSEELQGKTPPIEVIFAEGVPFSNTLLMLGLVNVTLKEDLNIRECLNLQILQLDTLLFPNDSYLDLSSFTYLNEIVLRCLNLKRLTIPSAQLEKCWLVTREDLRGKTPPMEVLFSQREQFSNTLLELCLINVTIKETLNIRQCLNLQILQLDKLLFQNDSYLDLSSFTDLNSIVLRDINAKQVTITPAQLKMFWVDVREGLIGKTPPIEVRFAEGKPFSNTLLELRLVNVTLKEDLDIRECHKLQILHLDTFTFHDDFHLDLSSFIDLTDVILLDVNVKQVTITPAKLRTFWVLTREDMREKLPPIEVIFANGKEFSNKLLELILVNVSFNEDVNVKQCDKLEILRLHM